ncbi:MAG: hypothetical protein U5J63_00095 [Fodinibius sp.]|nr:hypothetical protein [Fodinibius sp.]
MNKQYLLSIAPIVLGICLLAFMPTKEVIMEELSIGSKAPMADVEVEDVSGEMVTLNEVAGENGLLVNFSCNTCPWVSAWENRYNPVAQLAKREWHWRDSAESKCSYS